MLIFHNRELVDGIYILPHKCYCFCVITKTLISKYSSCHQWCEFVETCLLIKIVKGEIRRRNLQFSSQRKFVWCSVELISVSIVLVNRGCIQFTSLTMLSWHWATDTTVMYITGLPYLFCQSEIRQKLHDTPSAPLYCLTF